jgi:hypothetical protein
VPLKRCPKPSPHAGAIEGLMRRMAHAATGALHQRDMFIVCGMQTAYSSIPIGLYGGILHDRGIQANPCPSTTHTGYTILFRMPLLRVTPGDCVGAE